jgi:UDP-2,3-diacylglucosamine pyrophosphatase LpxH
MTIEAFVLSDLHLGASKIEPKLEDFDQDDQLTDFLHRVARPTVSLFINGDFIDFPQIPPYDVGPADHLLWAENASLAKLESAMDSHPKVFSGLRVFVDKGGSLTLHAGNHDLDLAWPGVQRRLLQALGQGVGFKMTSSLYHGVLVEHGHMFSPENAPKKADAFIHSHTRDDVTTEYLERVWGTDFMLQFYNDLERDHPFADNVKPTLTALYYGIRNRWVRARDIIRLLLFLKRVGIPWAGLGSAVLAGPPQPDRVPLSFEDLDWRKALGERMAADARFRNDLERELDALASDQKSLVNDGRKVTLDVSEPPTASVGTMPLVREDRQIRCAKERLKTDGVTHVIFGHTHEVIDGGLGGCLFNTGTWLPNLDFKRPDVREKIKAHGLTLAMLDDRSLYDQKRTVARVVPDQTGRARVELMCADDVK